MGEGAEYECPDCGSTFFEGVERCPGCDAEIDWDLPGDEATEEGPKDLEVPSERQAPGKEVERGPTRTFSRVGTACALLTVMAFAGTVLLLRWDTWVQGAAEDSIGDDQRVLIYAGAIATMAFAIASIFDVLRGVLRGDLDEGSGSA